jgi:hypothetical protein
MKRKIFLSVAFGVVAFIIAWALGTVLNVATGIPLVGGLLNGVLTAMVLVIGMLATRYFGSSTIMWIVFALMASITTTLGPPGIYKVIIGLIAGIIWDSVYYVSGYRKWGLYLGGILGSASIMFSLVGALTLGFGENAAAALERYQSAFIMILGMNLIVTFVGLFLGKMVYDTRLSHLSSFKKLSE